MPHSSIVCFLVIPYYHNSFSLDTPHTARSKRTAGIGRGQDLIDEVLDVDLHGVQARDRAGLAVQQERELRTAQDDCLDAVLRAHTRHDRLEAGQGLFLYDVVLQL